MDSAASEDTSPESIALGGSRLSEQEQHGVDGVGQNGNGNIQETEETGGSAGHSADSTLSPASPDPENAPGLAPEYLRKTDGSDKRKRSLDLGGYNYHNHSHSHHHSHSSHSNARRNLGGSSQNHYADENDLSELELEAYHFQKIVATFKLYKKLSLDKLKRTEHYVRSLPARHQELLTDYVEHQKSLRSCIEVNQNLFQLFVHEQASLFENHDEFYPSVKCLPPVEQKITSLDFERLQAILKHIVRDWSELGEKERVSCYKPILDEIETQFPENRENVRVLVPGAGLGRLAYDIVRLGYEAQGNEFSLLMLFASNFILNKCNGKNLYKCFPWIHQNTNVLNHEDQLKEVTFPDVNPTSFSRPNAKFSMTAGDFLDVYGKPDNLGAWDCIATCFFLDCAHNVVEFLEKIYNCLKENGVWINLGPLLYHYFDIPDEDSIEPSYDFVISIARKIGFTVLKETTNLPTYYTENSMSMLNYSYRSVFIVCKKISAQSKQS